MDDTEVEPLKIAQILPEFCEGGVERYVFWLSNTLVATGNKVTVITAGGKLEGKLDPAVVLWKLPVQRKNPITGFVSALRIACRAKHEDWDIIHAHSRVPIWIAWWASILCRKPWVLTAHDRYRKNWAIFPFAKSNGVICVSEAVKDHLQGRLPLNTVVIRDGVPPTEWRWQAAKGNVGKMLFVGRLTRRKGLDTVLRALSALKIRSWTLDVVGDGPERRDLEKLTEDLGIASRVFFHGFSECPEEWMAESDMLLFPSLDEGLGLVLMQAIQVGIPVLASDIEPVREIVGDRSGLVTPGDVEKWRKRIETILTGEGKPPVYDPASVPGLKEMTDSVFRFLESVADPSRTPRC